MCRLTMAQVIDARARPSDHGATALKFSGAHERKLASSIYWSLHTLIRFCVLRRGLLFLVLF
jgi:hypothetical protein